VARSLTPNEQVYAKQMWPNMDAAAVVVTDEPTLRYNCLAWSLGIQTSWIWPWGLAAVSKAEFDVLYASFGFLPVSSGSVAAFGLGPDNMQHACVSGPGHGPRWESKCGAWVRLQHGLAEMEGGVLYGSVVGFYARSEDAGQGQAGRLATMKTQTLSKADLKFLRERVQRVNPETRQRFDAAYRAWKEACEHPFILASSSPHARTQTPTFLELLALGTDIVPLLMEKLTHPDEFFALLAVDRLIRPEFVISHEPGDPAVVLGEQGRVIETVKQWIRTEA
jgi:hypothetical protein